MPAIGHHREYIFTCAILTVAVAICMSLTVCVSLPMLTCLVSVVVSLIFLSSIDKWTAKSTTTLVFDAFALVIVFVKVSYLQF